MDLDTLWTFGIQQARKHFLANATASHVWSGHRKPGEKKITVKEETKVVASGTGTAMRKQLAGHSQFKGKKDDGPSYKFKTSLVQYKNVSA
jgi:hypothetical protein